MTSPLIRLFQWHCVPTKELNDISYIKSIEAKIWDRNVNAFCNFNNISWYNSIKLIILCTSSCGLLKSVHSESK